MNWAQGVGVPFWPGVSSLFFGFCLLGVVLQILLGLTWTPGGLLCVCSWLLGVVWRIVLVMNRVLGSRQGFLFGPGCCFAYATPRRDRNPKTRGPLEFWHPDFAKVAPSLVFYECFLSLVCSTEDVLPVPTSCFAVLRSCGCPSASANQHKNLARKGPRPWGGFLQCRSNCF